MAGRARVRLDPEAAGDRGAARRSTGWREDAVGQPADRSHQARRAARVGVSTIMVLSLGLRPRHRRSLPPLVSRQPWALLPAAPRRRLGAGARADAQAPQAAGPVRGAVPRGPRPAVARHPRGARVHDRHGHGGRRGAGSDRPGVQEDVRGAELRHLPLKDALDEPCRARADHRRAVLRDGRAHPARDRRQPVGDPRQPLRTSCGSASRFSARCGSTRRTGA